MLQADNLSKSYGGVLLFDNVSFCLQKGEKCALVGRNGSGKTTLFKILKKEEEADGGRVCLPKGYKLGFLEQHIQFTKNTVLEEALDGPIQKEPYEVESILFGLGFSDEQLDSCPSLLSGGYHLRLKLAKLLALEPNCLLLDEPTNYLDIAGLRWLENHLKSWKGECVLISHERSFLDSIVTHTMGLHRKTLKKHKGDTEDFYQKIVEEEELHEKTRLTLDKKKKHLEDYIARFGAKASKATQAKSKAKALTKLPALSQLSALDGLSFSFTYTPFTGKKMLSLEDISFSYKPERPLIQNVSMEIERGKKIAIIGKNGMGKSTLLQLINGDLTPNSGKTFISDQARIGYFGQTHISRLCLDHTIEEEIASANIKLNFTQIKALCGHMLFSGDTAKKKIALLSGGERSRVLLGKILASPTNLLLLDEPTHHLDIESIEALLEAIQEFEGAVILVTHSEEMLKKIDTDYLIICDKNSQRIFLGTYTEFLEQEGWEDDLGSKKNSKPKDTSKQERAILIQQRSKELSPLQNEATSLEKQIEELEKKLQETEASLLIAYEKTLSTTITELVPLSAKLKKEIEGLYKKLDKIYLSIESIEAKFPSLKE